MMACLATRIFEQVGSAKAAWLEGEAGGQTLLQLKGDLGGHLRDLVSKVGQIVVDVGCVQGRWRAAARRQLPGALRWRRTWAYRIGFVGFM